MQRCRQGACGVAPVICGCAGDEAMSILVAELEKLERQEYSDTPEREALRILFDSLGWLEHGVSARAGWITPAGSSALHELREQINS